MHKTWDYLTFIILCIGCLSCYITYWNYHIYSLNNLHLVLSYFMIINLIQTIYFLYLLALVFMFYGVCSLFNYLKPSPSNYPSNMLITSENEPLKVDFLSNKDWNNVGMSILPGRQQAKNKRNLEIDMKRIINELNIDFIVTLMPNYQLKACNCSNIFDIANQYNSNTFHYPIHDFVVPHDINDFDKNCIDLVISKQLELYKKNKNMLIHCYGGQGRTGTVIAAMLMKSNKSVFDLGKCIDMMRSVRGPRMLTNPLQQQFCRVYYHYFCNDKFKQR